MMLWMQEVLMTLAWGLLLPAALLALYLGGLALLAWPRRRGAPGRSQTRFTVVVPAHNEGEHVAATVKSLLAVDYPVGLREVVVVADNCNDDTARFAEAAGATVWVRHDPQLRGKGYALDFAFAHIEKRGWADAVVIVDADSLATPNLLRVFDAGLQRGELVLQVEHGVRNPHASWRTRLMTVAFAMFHGVRSLGRERLGLSVGLRGNGMCFSTEALRRCPHKAYGLVEDVEYGIALAKAGMRVAWAEGAAVNSEMVTTGKAAVSQRNRWEGGRFALARQEAPGLFLLALRRRSGMLLDLAVDLIVPPLTYVALLLGLGVCMCIGLVAMQVGVGAAGEPLGLSQVATALGMHGGLLACWLACIAGVGLHGARGVALSGLGWRGWWTLLVMPAYVTWKLGLLARGLAARWVVRLWHRLRGKSGADAGGPGGGAGAGSGGAGAAWVRTAREGRAVGT